MISVLVDRVSVAGLFWGGAGGCGGVFVCVAAGECGAVGGCGPDAVCICGGVGCWTVAVDSGEFDGEVCEGWWECADCGGDFGVAPGEDSDTWSGCGGGRDAGKGVRDVKKGK